MKKMQVKIEIEIEIVIEVSSQFVDYKIQWKSNNRNVIILTFLFISDELD